MLVLPIHTAELERNCSLAGRVKTNWQNHLHSTTASDLMMPSLSSLSVDSFQAERAIEPWTLSCNRKRMSHALHGPHSKRTKKKKKILTILSSTLLSSPLFFGYNQFRFSRVCYFFLFLIPQACPSVLQMVVLHDFQLVVYPKGTGSFTLGV